MGSTEYFGFETDVSALLRQNSTFVAEAATSAEQVARPVRPRPTSWAMAGGVRSNVTA